jgi:hypothetical protein
MGLHNTGFRVEHIIITLRNTGLPMGRIQNVWTSMFAYNTLVNLPSFQERICEARENLFENTVLDIWVCKVHSTSSERMDS